MRLAQRRVARGINSPARRPESALLVLCFFRLAIISWPNCSIDTVHQHKSRLPAKSHGAADGAGISMLYLCLIRVLAHGIILDMNVGTAMHEAG